VYRAQQQAAVPVTVLATAQIVPIAAF